MTRPLSPTLKDPQKTAVEVQSVSPRYHASRPMDWQQRAILIVAWYSSNLGLLLLNKALLTTFQFKFPFLLTLLHMMTSVALSTVFAALNVIPAQFVHSWKQLSKIALLAIAFCFTILLGNIALQYIPVSFTQAIGATTPFFTAILALLIQRKQESVYTYLTLIPIMGGITLAIRYEPRFSIFGFAVCVAATALRALKTVLQGVLLEDGEKMGSMALLMHMAPLSVVLLIPLTAINEPSGLGTVVTLISRDWMFTGLLVLNCLLAYFVNLFNFLVTQHCGALTLQVLGNAKGIIAAVISTFLFGNHVTVMGWFGYGITISGVFAYSESKKARANSNTLLDQIQYLRLPGSDRAAGRGHSDDIKK